MLMLATPVTPRARAQLSSLSTGIGKHFRTADEDIFSFGRLMSSITQPSVSCRRHRLCLGVVGGLRQMVGDRPSPVH